MSDCRVVIQLISIEDTMKILLLIAAVALSAPAVQSATYRVDYEASVLRLFEATPSAEPLKFDITHVASSDRFPGHVISVGDMVKISYIVNTDQDRMTISDDGFQAVYFDMIGGGSLQIGSLSRTFGDGTVSVVDGRSGSDLVQLSFGGRGGDDIFLHSYTSFIDSTGSIIDGFRPPKAESPIWAETVLSQVGVVFRDDTQLQISADHGSTVVTVLSAEPPAPVPLPASAPLFLAGLGAIAMLRLRRCYSPRLRRLRAAG